MRSSLACFALVMTAALCLGAAPATAQIDVELAFTPDTASPGDAVRLFVSIANLGDEAVVAQLDVTLTFGARTIGPIQGRLPLAAGEERSREVMFIVPPTATAGTLTITVTATAGAFSDTASATLTIVTGTPASVDEGWLRGLGGQVLGAFGATPLAVQPASFAAVKRLYR